MATDPSPDLTLMPLEGKPRTLAQQLTTFQLLAVALDPFEAPSSWLLPTARRVLTHFREADCRVAFLITCGPDDARTYLGTLAQDFLVFCDENRSVVKALGLGSLPALVHLDSHGSVHGEAEGWDPERWEVVCKEAARVLGHAPIELPGPRDPGAFEGTPV